MEKKQGLDTTAIHGGEPRPGIGRAVTLPIFQTSTYAYTGESDYNDIKYIRLNNTPNHEVLSKKLALLEECEDAMVMASGMAAITTSLLALVPVGKHLLVQNDLYGGTHHFLAKDFSSFGRKVTFFSLDALDSLPSLVTKDTVAIYVESLSNPLLRVPNFEKIVDFAKGHRLISFIDNTYPSPVNFVPARLGFDLVLHSATKYLNGHSDIVAGCVSGSRKWVKEITLLLNHLGGTLDPHACFLLQRGLKTLGVRVRSQTETAGKLAKALSQNTKVAKVFYPGLESHPDYLLAKKYFQGFGAMLGFEYQGSAAETDAVLSRLKLSQVAPSLGGVESLVTRPVTTSHSGVDPQARKLMGISDNLVRVSVGLENSEDLIADFQQALG